MAAGCGSDLSALVNPGVSARLAGASPSGTPPTWVALIFEGGASPIHPGVHFEGLDLTEFPLPGGLTLADRAEQFQQGLWQRTSERLAQLPDVGVVLYLHDLADGPPDADTTVVLLTQSLSRSTPSRLGEAEYDPCNRQLDNAAILYGQAIRKLADVLTLNEWVNVFANVCAHEIAHTLGFGHVPRDSLNGFSTPGTVELMLDAHTLQELVQPQQPLVAQSHCPQETHEHETASSHAAAPDKERSRRHECLSRWRR